MRQSKFSNFEHKLGRIEKGKQKIDFDDLIDTYRSALDNIVSGNWKTGFKKVFMARIFHLFFSSLQREHLPRLHECSKE